MFAWLRSSKEKKRSEPNEVSHGTPKVRVVFMGTPKLSASLLSALIENDYNIVGVVTKPDSTVGRKKELEESEVKKVALLKNIPVFQPYKLDAASIQTIRDWKPDLIVVAAYGKILPKEILDIPGFGCVNFHTSLLPSFRGASPIQNALLSGVSETGVTLMLMDEGMDTGDIIAQAKVSIDPDEMRDQLTEKLLILGTTLLLETLPLWIKRKIVPVQQDESLATLCQLIEREDGHVMWTDGAESIYNRYRALTPWPGLFSFWKKDNGLLRLKLNKITYQKQNPQTPHSIGEVFELGEKVGVQTGLGVVFLEEVQLEGKNSTPISDFLRGNTLIGEHLQ